MSYPDRLKKPIHAVDDGKARSYANTKVAIDPNETQMTKSQALRVLRHFFVGARLQDKTKPEDRAAGCVRWQLWSGWEKPIIEATAPPEILPKAMVYGALKCIGLDATLTGTRLTFKKREPVPFKEPDQNGERTLHLGEKEPA